MTIQFSHGNISVFNPSVIITVSDIVVGHSLIEPNYFSPIECFHFDHVRIYVSLELLQLSDLFLDGIDV